MIFFTKISISGSSKLLAKNIDQYAILIYDYIYFVNFFELRWTNLIIWGGVLFQEISIFFDY